MDSSDTHPNAPRPRGGVLAFPVERGANAVLWMAGHHFRATGADRTPLPAAQLWPVEPGTDTPKAVFTDDTYTMAFGRSVVADASGLFPPMHAPDGEVVEFVLADHDGRELLRYRATAGGGHA